MAGRVRRYVVLAVLAVALIGILYGGTLAMYHAQMYLLRRTRAPERPTLAMALAALDHQSYLEARRLAEAVDRATLEPADAGGPDYVLGVVAAHEASELWGPERKNYFLLAARYLRVARERKFSQATGPVGTVLLGESLYYRRPREGQPAGAGRSDRACSRRRDDAAPAAGRRLAPQAEARFAKSPRAQSPIPGRRRACR